MAKWHGISRRKPSGGRLKRPNRYRGKRRTEVSSEAQYAYIGEKDDRKMYRKNAGSQTTRLLSANTVNVNIPNEGTTVKATFNSVIANDADPNFIRRNIVTKGSIVDTSMGKVKITSRPGMHGVASGILLED